jgi:hypothetical protein
MARAASILASAVSLVAAMAVGGIVFVSSASSAVTTQVATFPIATFTPAAETTHNRQGSSVCAAFQQSEPSSENHGDLNAAKGSFLQRVALPNGSVVHRLNLFANDNDGSGNAYVFLVRKLLQPGLSPQFGGYLVMASTATRGATLNTMRRFSDTSIVGARINNASYEYYLEVVNCAVVEPFAAQIVYTH